MADNNSIYCAEQIVVPIDLGDILKAYTKEVIRRQPQDLVDFSAKYFANLASVAQGDKELTAPTMEQLKLLYERAGGETALAISQVEALCSQAGVGPGVVSRVIQGGKFNAAEPIDLDRYLFLLLAMSCDNFGSVTKGIFDLFGEKLQAARFTKFIAFLAPDMDPDVTTQFLAELNSALVDISTVTYEVVAKIDVITAKLG